MKAKRLLTLLEGLCKTDPEANITFRIAPNKEDDLAKVQLGGYDVLTCLDIEAIYNAFGCPGGDEPDNAGESFMDIIVDLDYYNLRKKQEIMQLGKKEFDKMYKKVAE